MLDQVVKCEGVKNGCEWEGEIRSLDQHKSTCLHVPVPCPQECDVGSVLRGDLQSHLRDYCSQRDYECPHCLQMGRYRERVTSHLQDCPMVLTECPNEGCTKTIVSSQIPAHVANDCPFTVLPCGYNEAGCKVQLPRRDLEEHENDLKLHLQVIMKYSHVKITALQSEVQTITTTNLSLQSEVKKLTRANTTLQKKLTTATASLQSDVEKFSSSLQNDLEILTGAVQKTFRITGYRAKKEKNAVYQSPPFYTSSEGYRMCIRVYLHGNYGGEDMGTHISVYAVLLKGDHDDKLSWAFVGEVTVTLLNQLENTNHYVQKIKIEQENKLTAGYGWGCAKFIAHSKLTAKNTAYLKDDTLSFRVSASVPGSKPWSVVAKLFFLLFYFFLIFVLSN